MLYNQFERDRDLIKAIKREIAACDKSEMIVLKDILERAINGGAPRFYVDFETAVDTMSRYFRNGKFRQGGRRQRQWEEIAALVKTYREAHPDTPIAGAVAHVLMNCPASGFFLSVRQAYSIYNEHLRFVNYRNRA
ncbi:MAG: hypothetical protein HUK13_07890 [Muribaculaceae bacterium]|nr:hypothetical protein [Muribaculaceae bacterium]MCF0214340.1 hypothetical protein [Muribaculaceae bacterium]